MLTSRFIRVQVTVFILTTHDVDEDCSNVNNGNLMSEGRSKKMNRNPTEKFKKGMNVNASTPWD